jgi:hypothetical protein
MMIQCSKTMKGASSHHRGFFDAGWKIQSMSSAMESELGVKSEDHHHC